jgi:hypothetical protein
VLLVKLEVPLWINDHPKLVDELLKLALVILKKAVYTAPVTVPFVTLM